MMCCLISSVHDFLVFATFSLTECLLFSGGMFHQEYSQAKHWTHTGFGTRMVRDTHMEVQLTLTSHIHHAFQTPNRHVSEQYPSHMTGFSSHRALFCSALLAANLQAEHRSAHLFSACPAPRPSACWYQQRRGPTMDHSRWTVCGSNGYQLAACSWESRVAFATWRERRRAINKVILIVNNNKVLLITANNVKQLERADLSV